MNEKEKQNTRYVGFTQAIGAASLEREEDDDNA